MSLGRKLFGLFDNGKRLYKFEEGEVDREQFEYCVQLMDLVFGDQGYVDTLGPTWNMVHDPRFEEIENCFLRTKRTLFGGDPRLGTQTCLPDGTFISGAQDLEQYAEIIGEGRHYHQVVASSNQDPREVKNWPDEKIWALIRQESTQQFTRKGLPNHNAQLYFKFLKTDLLGLIADYAELAKVQEWVMLEENGRLVEEEDIKAYEETGDNHRVWLEIDILEKALTFRAQLRVTAALILNKLQIEESVIGIAGGLTDGERDTLLKLVYGSKWPDERTELLTKIVGWLGSLKLQGTLEERQAQQNAQFSAESHKFIDGLKDGSIQPITRYTEPVIEVASSPEEKAMEAILNDPLKQLVLLRVGDAEKRIMAIDATLEIIQKQREGETDEEKLLDFTVETNSLLETKTRLQSVADLLLPIINDGDTPFTDEMFKEIMRKAEDIDPRLAKIISVEEPPPDEPKLLN